MTIPDIRVQVLEFTAAHDVDKVMQMIFRPVCKELFNFLAVIVISPSTALFSAGKVSALAMHDISASDSLIMGPSANPFLLGHSRNLEEDRDWFIIVEYKLGIGRLTVIVPAETSAHTDDSRRKFILTNNPTAHVHLVDSLVAQVAVAGVPDPMPVEMQPLAHQGYVRRGAAPEIVIDVVWDLGRLIDLAYAGAILDTQAP